MYTSEPTSYDFIANDYTDIFLNEEEASEELEDIKQSAKQAGYDLQ